EALALDRPITLPGAADTRALGAALADLLRPGDLVVLAGPLGAGETTFAQGVAAGLGVAGPVISPTFVLVRVCSTGRLPLIHADAYRLGGVAEVEDLDLDLDSSATLVEWGEGLVEPFAEEHLVVRLHREPAQEVRTATLEAYGAGWRDRLTG